MKRGLRGASLHQAVVDADPSYVHSRYSRDLEPLAIVRINGARPDLVCTMERGTRRLVIGFEVKAKSSDWLPGLAQARNYRSGVHHAYLALPGAADELKHNTIEIAQESGVGILTLDGGTWHEVVWPADPRPLPWMVDATASILAGAPAARRLQLNHPLNYLVVPFLMMRYPTMSVMEALQAGWPDLQSPATRRHAVEGAITLELLDRNGNVTAEGSTVADLLDGLGFDPDRRPNKRRRLAEEAPAIAAVARSVLLRQPAVQLLVEVLLTRRGEALPLVELFMNARHEDESLAGALFLYDPSRSGVGELTGEEYNPSTVFKFKQMLWHAGILATKAHSTAGGRAADFQASEDLWMLDQRLFRRIRGSG